MIDIKNYKYFTVKLLESDDMTDDMPPTANYVIVNNVYDTIDMYEMSEVKAVNNAELMDHEKRARAERAIEAANLVLLQKQEVKTDGSIH